MYHILPKRVQFKVQVCSNGCKWVHIECKIWVISNGFATICRMWQLSTSLIVYDGCLLYLWYLMRSMTSQLKLMRILWCRWGHLALVQFISIFYKWQRGKSQFSMCGTECPMPGNGQQNSQAVPLFGRRTLAPGKNIVVPNAPSQMPLLGRWLWISLSTSEWSTMCVHYAGQ